MARRVAATAATADPRFHARAHPRYAEGAARINDLKGQLVAAQRAIGDVEGKDALARRDLRQLKAEALAAGLPEPTAPPPPDVAGVYERADVLERAVKVAEVNHRKAVAEISVPIIAEARPLYVELVRRVHAAAHELAAACRAEDEFIYGLMVGDTQLGPTLPRVSLGSDAEAAAGILHRIAHDANHGYQLGLPDAI